MLRYQNTDAQGGFIALGVGLRYEYDTTKHALRVATLGADTDLFTLLCPQRTKNDPEYLVHCLEKAACIKALMLSNNETINLSQTMNVCRLKPVLQNVFELAIQSHDFAFGHFDQFTSRLSNLYKLEDFQIKHMQCSRSGTAYYRLFVKIASGDDIVVRETECDTLLIKSAQHIVRDLIPPILSQPSRENADLLLMLSSRLSLIGRILNENYRPDLQVKDKKNLSQTG